MSADLRVVVGHCVRIDESILTGESIPVVKGIDDPLYSGTFVVDPTSETMSSRRR